MNGLASARLTAVSLALLVLVRSPLFALCGDGIVDPGETCDDGNSVGGDGCAANCTVEQSVPFPFRFASVMPTPLFAIPLESLGSATLSVGQLSPDGTIPAVIRADQIHFDPIPIPGLACECVQAVAAKRCVGGPADGSDCTADAQRCVQGTCVAMYGDGNVAAGVIDCAGTLPPDITITRDHNTHLLQPDPDPDCSAPGAMEDQTHPGACNGRAITTQSGAGVPGTAQLTASLAASLISDGGSCAAGCDAVSSSTAPDTIQLTTGNACAEIEHFNDRAVDNCASPIGCPVTVRTCVTGAPVDCDRLLADPAHGTAGAALASARPVLDTQMVGDYIDTRRLESTVETLCVGDCNDDGRV
ncbi:MAG TPA: hypothetical protein VL403_14350, partial [Candidatus Kryptonia bacterium]|nr:hypothetical protein [Candidatus Kryptonia bacterium]